jgi:hypothetical protein
MKLARAFAGALAMVALGAACTAFSGDSQESPDGTGDGGVETTMADGAVPACAALTPGEGPPPLHPEGGPPETNCGGAMVDLETSATNCGTCGQRCEGMPCVFGACASEPVYTGTASLIIRYARGARLVVATATSAIELSTDGGVLRTIGSLDSGSGEVVFDDETDWFVQHGGQAQQIGPDGTLRATVSLSGKPPISFVASREDLVYATARGGGHDTIALVGLTKDGGLVHDVAPKEPYATALVRDGDFLMWAQEPILVPDSGTAGQVVRRNLLGDDTQRSGPVGVSGALGFDGAFVYYFDGATKEIRRLPKSALAGATGETLATWRGPEKFAAAISAFGDFLYLLLTNGGRDGSVIARVHRCGGEPTVVVRDDGTSLEGAPVVADGKLFFARYKQIERTQP